MLSWFAVRGIFGSRYVVPVVNSERMLACMKEIVSCIPPDMIDEDLQDVLEPLEDGRVPILEGAVEDALFERKSEWWGALARRSKYVAAFNLRQWAYGFLRPYMVDDVGVPVPSLNELVEDLLEPTWPDPEEAGISGKAIAEFLGHPTRPWYLSVGVHQARHGVGPLANESFVPKSGLWNGSQVRDLFAWLVRTQVGEEVREDE